MPKALKYFKNGPKLCNLNDIEINTKSFISLYFIRQRTAPEYVYNKAYP